ncbi:CobW family GTP-binding protein [Anaeromassilibacillus senegalensis]|uniref:GTP-binding protein n=1 Tax=Anaeromassilibacillus senegalensis TaxID=1673717 RepID=A0ABS9CJI4_9FIRM|nr:CobW family GTP-binding protein [Anaeromassilibacillus senegalensis]MCF2651093.1 GTP-binding protein [Anaeromassilibacillus senegalensis]
MTKIDIFSGFLGAGKTTLIKKLIAEAFAGEKLVLIENEFGEIAIDGGFLQEAGIEITEMNSGCICCSLVGDFGEALRKVLAEFHPDRILIEPSGVGKLSDVIRAVQNLHMEDVQLNSFTTVADANKCKMYMKNFGEFYNDQIGHANSIILSRTAGISEQKLETCVKLLREHNATATIITTPWDALSGAQILEAMEHRNTLDEELRQLAEETEHEHHHHHDEDCDCHEHHHDHDHEEHGHEHHHDHDEHCTCGCHDHDHDHHDHEHGHDHHHHHADEIFTSWGIETTRKFTKEEIEQALVALNDSETYGTVLRAKGIVTGADGTWLHFDYVPEESEVREGAAMVTGRLCVIGSNLKEDALAQLFA